MYRRLQSGWLRAAAWAASTSKKRNKELPCIRVEFLLLDLEESITYSFL
jgi:hypothetical protein